MRRLISLLLAAGIYNACAVFPSAQELCTETKYGDRYAIDLITQAALVEAYKHPREEIAFPGWQVTRFDCDHRTTGSVHKHCGNFVMYNPEHKVAMVVFAGTNGKIWMLDPGWRQDSATTLHRANEDISESYISRKLDKFFSPKRLGARLYFGAKEMVTSCEKYVLNTLDDLKDNNGRTVNLKELKFILAGHSMGGALAILFTCLLFQHLGLENNHKRNISIFSFGAPMCVNGPAAHIMRVKLSSIDGCNELNELVRVVNVGACGAPDPVTLFPTGVREKFATGAKVFVNANGLLVALKAIGAVSLGVAGTVALCAAIPVGMLALGGLFLSYDLRYVHINSQVLTLNGGATHSADVYLERCMHKVRSLRADHQLDSGLINIYRES